MTREREIQQPTSKEDMGGMEGWVKEVKGKKSALLLLSTEKCTELRSHVVHLKVTLHCLPIMLELKKKNIWIKKALQ